MTGQARGDGLGVPSSALVFADPLPVAIEFPHTAKRNGPSLGAWARSQGRFGARF